MSLQVKQMTSRERILAAVKREEVDYVPCCPTFNELKEGQRVGYTYQFPWGPSQREKLEYCVNELGLDMAIQCGAGGFSPEKDVSSKVWMEDSVIHKVWSTPSGDLHCAVRYNENWPYGMDIPFYSDFNISYYVEPWLKTEEDVACLRHILKKSDNRDALEKWRFRFNEAKRFADRFHLPIVSTIGMGLTGAQHLCGAQELCLLTVDKPGLVHEYLELEHQLNLFNMEVAADFGVDIIIRNGFYETSDFYSPAMLEQFLAKRLNKEIDTVHQAGVPICYRVHTGIMPILGYLQALDFDCLQYIDIAFNDIDLEAVRGSQKERKSFWTGPSNTYHMWSKDPETVREAVREVFSVFGHEGLILAPCSSCHSIMPWQNTLAMVDEWKKLRTV